MSFLAPRWYGRIDSGNIPHEIIHILIAVKIYDLPVVVVEEYNGSSWLETRSSD
jgi:hypothetical protein